METVPNLVAHLFRHQSAQLTATLTRIFGPGRLDLVEDVVQETLIRALKHWPHGGIPDNPPAWLMQTAKHYALDLVRRDSNWRKKEPEIAAHMETALGSPTVPTEPRFQTELQDDLLRMLFACAHPSLSEDSQLPLALKTMCGLSISEISRAMLSDETTIAQRITRAKRRLREVESVIELPTISLLEDRLPAVFRMLYLLFNEGYSSTEGDELIRRDLCEEAIRLSLLLADKFPGRHELHALLALMYFQASRFESRTDTAGELLLLEEQNRATWNQEYISLGFASFERALGGLSPSTYHIQAAIAAEHVQASNYEKTNWKRLLHLYEELLNIENNPVVMLNKLVAVAMVDGANMALQQMENSDLANALDSYYLYHVTRAELFRRLGDASSMQQAASRALAMTIPSPIRNSIKRRFQTESTEQGNAGTT